MQNSVRALALFAAFTLVACGGGNNGGNNGGGAGGSQGGGAGGGAGGGSAEVCGDGIQTASEACDDGNTINDDGCSNVCTVQLGFACTGAPSTCAPICGDGVKVGNEACDDGNTATKDGCSDTCTVEAGFTCTGTPSSCASTCGDGVKVGNEACDDGNSNSGDGCAACAIESGYTCSGAPSNCSTTCGDGVKAGTEGCDDGNTTASDGCSATCTVETGYNCSGSPSVCQTSCGDGIKAGNEACDDGNVTLNDGCDTSCFVEQGFTCSGSPSVCQTTCGDGLIAGAEDCDDGNLVASDGCSATCMTETGYTCTGAPSVCATSCGDGIKAGNEACDDGNVTLNDGCDTSCFVEQGFTCSGSPSVCQTTCGDGLVAGAEACDDGNTNGMDGCLGCTIESGYACTGSPSVCAPICGDGVKTWDEACDDGNSTLNDGCSTNCTVESGFTCSGSPSTCATTCGDSITAGAEGCDDGNMVANDGCSATCTAESGYTCTGSPSTCTTTCGDNVKAGAEACDDGNTASGDCCSATCTVEAGCEVEVNDLFSSANTFGSVSIASRVNGWIRPTGDKDVYAITVAAGTTVSLTASTIDAWTGTNPCANNSQDSYLSILDSTGTSLQTDDDSGPGFCSLLTRTLTPGTWYVEVKASPLASGAAATFSYTLQLALQVTVCGNGTLETGEQCDDGNTVNGDGCSDTCRIESTPETESNNTCATANGPIVLNSMGASKLVSGAINPAADQDWFSFTVGAYADVKLETFDSTGPGSCAPSNVDTELQVLKSDCTTVQAATKDQGGIANCTRFDPAVDTGVRHLAPGTYNVKVFPYSATATFNYTMQLSVVAYCGNGVKEGSEQCDGGPLCSADCTKIPTCGDGTQDLPNEQCDDGNVVNGDGCSSTCKFEGPAEIEPNDTTAQADANPAITSTIKLKATIGTTTDVDTFKVTVAAQSTVRFEVFDKNGTDCVGMPTMTIKLLDSAGTQLKTDISGTVASGIGVCPALVVDLAPGSYYVRTAGSGTTVPTYQFEARFETSNGSEIETNDTIATATADPGTETVIFGDHQQDADVDVYRITVPTTGMSIRAEVIEGDATETCESLGIDSFITLLDSSGSAVLVSDDDDGRGFCSAIDGTGATPRDAAAHNLAAGTYFLSVTRSGTLTGPGVEFNYKLAVTIR